MSVDITSSVFLKFFTNNVKSVGEWLWMEVRLSGRAVMFDCS